MQESFDFASAEIMLWRRPLALRFGSLVDVPRRRPLGQMAKSLISSRTRDAVSLRAYRRMGRRWPKAIDLSRAAATAVEHAIFDVTFADKKAVHLVAAMRMIERERPDFSLEFLGDMPVEEALAWLERLPGVGRKVAAATLNASTLHRPVFIVDSHVHRVLVRLGFVGPSASPKAASEIMTASAPSLGADGLLELFGQMKRLGQEICRFETPLCSACPLQDRCRTGRRVKPKRNRADQRPYAGSDQPLTMAPPRSPKPAAAATRPAMPSLTPASRSATINAEERAAAVT
jgi:endonuclease III